MSVYYYYGNLRDATLTEGDVSFKTQYPITNINYLNKNLYSYADDNDTETYASTGYKYIPIAKIDFGSATAVDSAVLDLSTFRLQVSQNSVAEFDELYISIRYSTDDVTYSQAANFLNGSTDISSSTDYDETLTDIYTVRFTEQTARYWKVYVVIKITIIGDIDWDINGKINNLYVGDYLSLPCPELVPLGFEHKTNISESFAGFRNGIDNQGQRETWDYQFNDLTTTQKNNWKAFDLVNKNGAVPCYMEEVDTAQIVDPVFVRVYSDGKLTRSAYDRYNLTNRVEEEL